MDHVSGHEQVEALLEAAPDAMVAVDQDGVIRAANRQADALFGHAAGGLVGEAVETLVPERLRPRHGEHRARYADQPTVRPMGAGLQLSAQRRDGSELPVEISLAPLPTDAGLLVLAAVRDATERQEAERALRQALAHEREAAERLREIDQVKDEFLSFVSHELRTPLVAITGFAELLAGRDDLDPTARSMLERILRNAWNMVRLIEQLLDVSRLEAGAVRLAPEPVRFVDVVADCLGSLGRQLAEHEVQVEASDDLVVEVDPDGMARVLTNLLTNAVKFSPPGSTIEVWARPRDGWADVSVRDHGGGMAADELARIFDRFYQVGRQAGRRGTGIGLTIARRYAELHGSDLTVESAPGAGSTFTFSVPQAAPER